MGDYYTEQLIKRQAGMREVFIKALLAALAIVSVLSIFITPLGIMVPVIVIAVVCFLFTRLDVEYEYLFVNGDLDIDKIMHKSKRKRIFSADVSTLEILAPLGSPELNQYQNAKVCDYSSGTGSERLYALVIAEHGQQTKVIFEPNEIIVEGFYVLAPRKVVRK